MGTVFIRQLAMPCAVRGATVVDADGNYNVYINESLCDQQKIDTVQHELNHIRYGHFYDDATVEDNERDAEIVTALADARSHIWMDW